jgi:universal stress protein E
MSRIRNILVVVDPTAAEQPAIAKAALLAKGFNARVELFACETNALRELRLASHLRERLPAPLVVNLKAMLETFAVPLRARGLDVSTEVERFDPLHQAVINRARRARADLVVKDTAQRSEADIMVLGAIARRGLTRLFIGSTAEILLDRLPCDVLTVKRS